MWEFLRQLFQPGGFLPHGQCYFWQEDVLWANVIGDGLTVLAYFAIPFFLLYFLLNRKDLRYRWMFGFFALFILSCGTTHLISILTVWEPYYRLSGAVKIMTGVVSLATAALLIPVTPAALRVPSARSLRIANEKLEEEVEQRKAAEEELQQTNAELERYLDDLKHFAYATSHDLKEPLRGMVSFSQMVLQDEGDNLSEDGKKRMNFIVEEGLRMNSMVESVLDYTRLGSIKVNRQDLDLNELVAASKQYLHNLINKSNAKVTISKELPVVKGDASMVMRLLTNLIQNGIKFNDSDQPHISIGAERQNGLWRFSVADNGIGFDDRHSEKMFELFEVLHHDKTKRGSGIGLAVCKRMVDAHKGKIWAESKPGEGSTFYFTLPAS